jgi:Leucine-rich repeat (LRR) protein
VIRKSLPKNNLGSRIITSTCVHAVAMRFVEDNGVFLYKIAGLSMDASVSLCERIFKESCKDGGTVVSSGLCSSIAKMSGGMPLAVICLSSAVAAQLATEEDVGRVHDPDWFRMAEARALAGLTNIPCLKPLADSLCLAYNQLSVHLKTCLLHCSSLCPPYHIFGTDDLVRLWIAERFVYDEGDARSYVDQLVSTGMISVQSCSSDLLIGPKKVQMNTMMLHFLRCIASHEGYCIASSDCGSGMSSLLVGPIRRLSIQSCKNKVEISRLHASDIRSLYVFDRTWTTLFKNLTNLRVLQLLGNNLRNEDLTAICGLPHLTYLNLSGTLVNLLPEELGRLKLLKTLIVRGTGILRLPVGIGELMQLETLDLGDTMVVELPSQIVKLHNLRTLDLRNSSLCELPNEIGDLLLLETLDVGDTMVAELPSQIGKLQRLRALGISGTGIEKLPAEIGELEHLEILDVSCTTVAELPLPTAGGSMAMLQQLNICNTEIRELPWESGRRSVRVLCGDSDAPHVCNLADLSEGLLQPSVVVVLFDRFGSIWVPVPFPRIKVPGKHRSVPQFVASICYLEISLWKLEEDSLKSLREMPNLRGLALRVDVLPTKPAISILGFRKLESLCIDCRVPRITFEKEAMPELTYLEFKFYACRPTTEHNMGIANLQRLQRVVFRSASWYTSDPSAGIHAVINRVREEAREHPNTIILSVNGNVESYHEKKAAAAQGIKPSLSGDVSRLSDSRARTIRTIKTYAGESSAYN